MHLGPVRVRPGAVLGQGMALEVAEADVVEVGADEPGDAAAFECEVGRLLGALELRDDAEVDPSRGEHLTEPARLLAAGLGERAGGCRIAVGASDDRELALAVSREDHLVHARILAVPGGLPPRRDGRPALRKRAAGIEPA